MNAKGKRFADFTAADLMTSAPTTIPQEMSLRAAARLLSQDQISGAPVVDASGRCIGVFSSSDVVRWARRAEATTILLEAEPGCMCEWQVLDDERLPADQVHHYMTADAVTAPPRTSIVELARMMRDAHIHRVIIVDAMQRPVGIVTSTDLLSFIASHGRSWDANAAESAQFAASVS